MSSSLICALRSVALEVPDLAAAEAFYTRRWHLDVARAHRRCLYLRGTGQPIIICWRCTQAPARPRCATSRCARAMLRRWSAIAQAAVAAGGRVVRAPAPSTDPAGGTLLTSRDADGRVFEVVHGDAQHADARERKDRPIRLAHVVLNSHDVAATQRFFEQALGFRLADRTRIMAFMNCNRDHHSIALGDADNDALNHIAFLMPDLESVMRGGGRMKDAGFAIEWGPGRHGPGDNAFNYFIDPFGVVIEYTADVAADRRQLHAPAAPTTGSGRRAASTSGASPRRPRPRLKEAQREVVRFIAG